MPEDTSPVAHVPAGHLEAYLRSDVHTGDYGALSPDGAYVADSYGVQPAASLGTQIRVVCPELMTTGAWVDYLGWTDATHVIYTDGRRASLVTVSDTPTCQPLIPTTDKDISSIHLSEDGGKLYFRASNATGGTTDYSVPANSPGAQPALDTIPTIPLHALYRPGNY